MSPTGGSSHDHGSRPLAGLALLEFLERLRARPLSSWAHGDRYRHARNALATLAELDWAAEGRAGSPPAIPDLGAVAVGDQLTVLLVDAERAGADQRQLAVLVGDLADALQIRLDRGGRADRGDPA